MIKEGIYEALINKVLEAKLNDIDNGLFHIKDVPINKEEASQILSQYTTNVIHLALSQVKDEQPIERKIEICNKIIYLLRDELDDEDFEEDIIDTNGRILAAVFKRMDAEFSDFNNHLKKITPQSGLSQSELFTGSNVGLSMDSEIRKEILSADRIHFLVSFIKWSGIRIFKEELKSFTDKGGQLKIITTSYMGATDYKAIEFLSSLKNTEIKVSYNTQSERLHAKAYLFLRNSGYDTGYIGSSNMSRSALTNGLEWNLKLTTQEVKHIIKKFKKTFDTYWQNNEFELYKDIVDGIKLKKALKAERQKTATGCSNYFDIKPHDYQKEVLEKLETERCVHNRYKNLVVAATGTGKTVISAFDFQHFYRNNPCAKLLFVAHRKEILEQAITTFRGILKDNNFGELLVNGYEIDSYNALFASVQSLNNRIESLPLSSDFYDFIIIDEVHHIVANSYRPILQKFKPKILLGLTATPERTNSNENILPDFDDTIAAEIRLPSALNKKLLCPFQYFGITDNIDLSKVNWRQGQYVPSELTKLYTENDNRVRHVIDNIESYLTDPHRVRALGFCVNQEHAQFMAEKFTLAGYNADYLVSNNGNNRDQVRHQLIKGEINYLFVVDIYNEGVDIPEIDTALFLRPTQSLTVFLQQLGRGLRLSEGKECLTVLDFVGNSRPEYDFESKFRAMIGKTNNSTQKEIENEFPHLPLGCSIILEKKAKEIILANIKHAINLNRNQLIQKIQNFQFQSELELNLKNFTDFYHIPIEQIYKNRCWSGLCKEAGVIKVENEELNQIIARTVQKKWLACRSSSYFKFILRCIESNFSINFDKLNEKEKGMYLMLYYDVWQNANQHGSISDALLLLGENKTLLNEIKDVISYLLNRIDFMEYPLQLEYDIPLKVHSRYTRDQILAGFGYYSYDKKPSSREGVQELKERNIELLFITLNKSEKNYSPSTLYDDFAISEDIFHWQSQNSARPDKGRGLSYVEHKSKGKRIFLFVREANKDQFGNTMGFVFLGEGNILKHEGQKPMNIQWQLEEPMPPYLWKDAAKMAT